MKRRCPLELEILESRDVPSVVTVNAAQTVRVVNDQVLGVNEAWWDSTLNTPQTQQMVQAAGLTMFRLPGGSAADNFHFNAPPSYSGQGTVATMASFIASVGGVGMVTLNYGTGSPQEAAALLAYLNASVTNTTSIGFGEEWNSTSNAWVPEDWKTAAYWAGLRAATPLAKDDGLNFLRLGRSAPFAVHYFEVGNEEYGSWETDEHGQGTDPGKAHDPATYVTFAKAFATYAAQIDPTISIGIDSGSIGYDSNWTSNVLHQGVLHGFIPGFISDHSYMQGPGSESDSYLLLDTVSDSSSQDPNSPTSWAQRAAGYRALLKQQLGSAASGVELLATEYNSVYSNPGKQTTSLVNGLFVADSIGSMLQTEYNAGLFWDVGNGWETTNNNSASLYGWRQGGDYGLLGSSGTSPLPSTGNDVPYPTYFAEELASKMVHNGDTVVSAASNDINLSAYAVLQADGHLDLLVINKNPTTNLTEQFQIQGFQPNGQAQIYQYGKAQDTAQSLTTNGSSALLSSSTTLSLSGANFSYTFPSYSMTVIDLTNVTNQVVTGLTPTPTGFVAQFNRAFDPTTLNLYDTATAGYGPADVTLMPASGTAVRGSMVVNSTNTSFTFIKAGSGSAALLSPGTYTVTLRSAVNGFKDTLGDLLAGNTGNSTPGSNYVTTFTVAAASGPVLRIPDFARGPDGHDNIKIPNLTGTGIPITLGNAVGVTDVTFQLDYNPSLLNISGVLNGPAGTFALVSAAGGIASFAFHSGTPLSGTLTLGQILAQVPNSAASSYKAKELLHLTTIVVNSGSITAVAADGIHVNAYLGDTNGDGSLSGGDSSLIARVGVALDSGFAAYPLLDPTIVADVLDTGSIQASDVTLINSYLAGITRPQIPPTPAGLTIVPTGPDPTLSLPTDLQVTPGGTVNVPVYIDTARPDGSSGLTEAVLALRFDPRFFTVSADDVRLGSLAAGGNGWQLTTIVNSQTGEIGIDLFSATPIQTQAGGILVTIDVEVRARGSKVSDAGTEVALSPDPSHMAPLFLVTEVNPTGQRVFRTEAADAQGAFVVHRAGANVVDGGKWTVDGGRPTLNGAAVLEGGQRAVHDGEIGQGMFDDATQVDGGPWTVDGIDNTASSPSTVHRSPSTETPSTETPLQQDWVPADMIGNLEQTAHVDRRSLIDDTPDGSAPGTVEADFIPQ